MSIGIVLLALGGAGTVYSLRVARAQHGYWNIRYGTLASAESNAITATCEHAFSLYPHNYFLSLHAVSRLWPKARVSGVPLTDSDFALVDLWCARGLTQNPYHWKLHRARTKLLARDSISAAADHWESFVEWEFWNPANLVFLVECYAGAGRLAEASEILSLLKGQRGYGQAAAALRRAWAHEML